MALIIRRRKGTRRASRLGNISRYGVGTGQSFPRGWQHTQAFLRAKRRKQQRARRRAFNAAQKAAA